MANGDQKLTNKLDNQTFIATVMVLAFVALIFVWIFRPPAGVSQQAMAIINMLIGAFIASFNSIISFFFGSSKGSKDKDEALAKMTTTPREPPTTINFGAGKPAGAPSEVES